MLRGSAPTGRIRRRSEKCERASEATLQAGDERTKNTSSKRMRCFFGAGDEARTRYLHLGKVALYQMSYARIA